MMIAPLDYKPAPALNQEQAPITDKTVQKTKEVSSGISVEKKVTATPKRASTLETCAIIVIGIALEVAFFAIAYLGSNYRDQLHISKTAGKAMIGVGVSMCIVTLMATLFVYQWRIGFKPCMKESLVTPQI